MVGTPRDTSKASTREGLPQQVKGDVGAPPCLRVEQLRARHQELEEARLQLEQEHAELEREIERHGDSERTCAVARDMNRRIIKDDEALPHFTQASQNIATTAALLWGLLEPTTPEDHRAHREIRTLLEHVAAQQAKSSLSQRCELDASQRTPSERPDRDMSVHQA